MKSLLTLAGTLGCLGLLGCAAAPVTIPALRPAELDVAGVQRIAVLDFQGPAPYSELARSELSTALAAGGQRDVPPPHVVREMLPASVPYRGQPVDVRLVVEQARHAGFDAVLVGEVFCQSNAKNQLVIGNPIVEARCETQLIDVRSGQVRGATKSSRKWRGELSSRENSPNTQRKITEKLVRECTSEAAGKLVARTESIEVALSESSQGDDEAAMHAGRDAAAAGNWTLAAEHFERARAANPTSHAAIHNLALACEAQFNFAAARHWHSEALRLHEADDYRTALARVDTSWRDYDLAMRQTRPPQGPTFAEREPRPQFAPASWQQ
jgi:hypothetical protein